MACLAGWIGVRVSAKLCSSSLNGLVLKFILSNNKIKFYKHNTLFLLGIIRHFVERDRAGVSIILGKEKTHPCCWRSYLVIAAVLSTIGIFFFVDRAGL